MLKQYTPFQFVRDVRVKRNRAENFTESVHLKRHVALDRVSWYMKRVWIPFIRKCIIWLKRCFKSRI